MGLVVKSFKNKGGFLLGKGFFLAIGLWMIGLSVFYVTPAWSMDAAQQKALIASLPQGETFENDGASYVYLPTLRGEKTADTTSESSVNKTSLAAEEGVVLRKGLFTIYQQGSALQTQSAGSPAHPVVLNLETNSLGILTGRLWLKLKDLEDAQPLADTYGMTLSFVNAPMSTAFYEVREGTDILTLRKALNKDPRIIRATLDMVDRVRHPQ